MKKTFLTFLIFFFGFHIFEKIISPFLNSFIHYLAINFFNIDYNFESAGRGSGDNTFQYLYLFITAILSIIISLINLLIFKNKNIKDIQVNLFMIVLRFYLIFNITIYGLSKVLGLQFPSITIFRLEHSYGESSPMGLAWTFMQYSHSYVAFTGITEIVGALLLLNRKTVILGSFILVGVLSNVVAINFCFDIPVKINSTFYLLAAIILLVSQWRLISHLINEIKLFQNKIISKDNKFLNNKNSAIYFKICLMILVFLTLSLVYYNSNINRISSSFSGVYKKISPEEKISSYDLNKLKFKTLIVENNRAVIIDNHDMKHFYNIKIDSSKNTIQLKELKNKHEINFIYSFSKGNLLLKTNESKDDGILFKKKRKMDYRLINTGFNWINETPNNK